MTNTTANKVMNKVMNKLQIMLLLLISTILLIPNANAALYVTIVQGLGGLPEYDDKFADQAQKIYDASITLADASHVTSMAGDDATRSALLIHFQNLAESMNEDDRAAIYLVGHGSYDGEQYKFNISGPDITDADLAEILESFPGQNHFLVNTSSTSGAILDGLESDQRVIITATRNGNEKNATEFGNYFAAALASDIADINKNNNVSIQEAFDFAERSVAEFFESSGKLATEHPQIRGEGAASFSLARVEPLATSDENPRINALISRRLELDTEIESLQLRRNEFSNVEYIQNLQALILESAEISEQIDSLREGTQANVQ
ncbi:MAG: hypothetical protein HOK55_11340 [Gammaproteobacteria bacterium]|nr:hypothetical protein [Gammaproteobacteria bacterium]